MLMLVLVVATLLALCDAGLYFSKCSPPPETSTHDFYSRDLKDSKEVSIGELTNGKLTMIVNVATFCTYTQQYIQMNELFDWFPPNEFTIVAFPSNQFGHQEPGANRTEILHGLFYVRPGHGFKPDRNLHMMIKRDVNGLGESELYTYLKESCPNPSTATFDPRQVLWEPIKLSDVAWNFEKFLVSPSGVPLYRFRSMVEPRDLLSVLKALKPLTVNKNEEEEQEEPAVNIADQALQLDQLLSDLDQEVGDREKRKEYWYH